MPDKKTPAEKPCPGESSDKASLSLLIGEKLSGMRADNALKEICQLSLRGRRRLFGDGHVFLNNRRAKAGDCVRAGDRLTVRAVEEDRKRDTVPANCTLVFRDEEYAFFSKPCGLHTVALQGRDSPSLEEAVPFIMPGIPASWQLLQRLDYGTSGIVACALTEEARLSFRMAEQKGLIEKRYVCLLAGELAKERVIKARLVSSGHGSVRALEEEDSDTARHTAFYPLLAAPLNTLLPCPSDKMATLAGVCLHRGARHQIRCHAASMNLPLLFDTQYGAEGHEGFSFFLHHGDLKALGRRVSLLPDWPLRNESAKKAVRLFLNG